MIFALDELEEALIVALIRTYFCVIDKLIGPTVAPPDQFFSDFLVRNVDRPILWKYSWDEPDDMTVKGATEVTCESQNHPPGARPA